MKTSLMVKCGVSLGVVVLVAAAAAAAEFVSPQEKAPANGAAAVFEKSFANRGAIRRATWDVTAQGVFEAFANGRRVGNDFLKPGVTECGKCRHVYSYDVTGLLDCRAGATNVLSATVTPGWWCDQMMRPPAKVSDWQRGNKREWQLGKEIAFRGELRLEFDDGSAQTVGTDESWLAAYTGPLVSAGIYEGEVYDARRRVEGLKGVRRNTEFAGELRPAAAKIALREDLVLTPREAYVVKGVEGASKDAFGVAKVIRRYKDGEDVRLEPSEMLVIDFGQNCSAVPSFEVTGESGAELEIRAAEMLNESHGEKSRGNDGPARTPYLASLRTAYAGIRYTLKDGRQAYMPRYTYFGYRYLGATATRPVVFARWRSTPVSSVTREMERGRIVTGNVHVNRLIANIRWGLLSNYLSSPTDCPQRDERMGWTADTQVFMNSAAYFADTSGFLGKYLADLRDAQRASGCYMCFVPNVRHTFPPWASAGWTDAGVIIPYRLWKWYGDRRFIDVSWGSMVRYMDFLEGNAEPYRINHGDWLAFEHHKKNAGDAMDGRQVKALNAYFRVWMAMLMREMAAATGRGAAERHYAEEEAKLRQAFAAAYVGPDGTIKDEYKGQCNDLYMLKLGLCGGAAAVEATKRDLIANIKACGNRLQTGFLGTAILMPTLTFEANAPELAYSLLLQDAFPSWLYSVDQGATTVWERWNGYTKEKGFGPVGMNSFNHYAYGCVAEWLFAAAAGIRQPKGAVGWKRFLLAPIPDKRLGSVDATFISPEGEIRSSWRYDDDGKWTWTFVVPKGTSAMVSAPGIPEREYGPGEWSVTDASRTLRADVFVAGAGPAGFVAAIAAARNGAKVTLAESFGFPGGMATAGLVGPISKFNFAGRRVVGGIPWEFVERLAAAGGAITDLPKGNVPFEAEVYRRVAREMLEEAGVTCLWQTQVCGEPELAADGSIAAVTLSTGGFLTRMEAKRFIDCTASGAIVGHHGFGAFRSEKGAAQPLSLCFILGGVDTDKARVLVRNDNERSANPTLRAALNEAMAAGRIKSFGGPWAVWGSTIRPGFVSVNATRAEAADVTDPVQIAAATERMRREIPAIMDVMRQADPAFRNAWLAQTATTSGFRECREIKALHRVTAAEFASGADVSDAIALAAHPMDRHLVGSSGQNLTFLKRPGVIPLSALVSAKCPNLLAAGGLVAAEPAAFASMRVQAQCMAMGQAAGTLAAFMPGEDVRQLDFVAVRRLCESQGAITK